MKLTITRISRQTTRQLMTFNAFCPDCGKITEMMTASESAAFLEIEDQSLDELMASGKIHALATISGNFRICKDSLFEKKKF